MSGAGSCSQAGVPASPSLGVQDSPAALPPCRPPDTHHRVHPGRGPEARGKGVGIVATRLPLDYAFHVIGLDMVWIKVLEPNTAGRNAYAKASFRKVGTMCSAGVRKDHRFGEMVMDSLPKDFPWPCRECSGAAFSGRSEGFGVGRGVRSGDESPRCRQRWGPAVPDETRSVRLWTTGTAGWAPGRWWGSPRRA